MFTQSEAALIASANPAAAQQILDGLAKLYANAELAQQVPGTALFAPEAHAYRLSLLNLRHALQRAVSDL